MALVSSVDYPNRRIYLGPDSVGVILDTLDIYREVRALRRTNESHRKYLPIISAGGNIQKTLTTFTQPYVQLLRGCRIVPYDTDQSMTVIRETFTDDGLAGKDCFDRNAINANVDIDFSVDKVEVRLVSTGGGGGATPAEIWSHPSRTLTESAGLTEAQDALLRGTATKGDVNFSPSLTYEEKVSLFRLLDDISTRPDPVLDLTPLSTDIKSTHTLIEKLPKKADLKITVQAPNDPNIPKITDALEKISRTITPVEKITEMIDLLTQIHGRHIDKEAIGFLSEKIQTMKKEEIQDIEKLIQDTLRIATEHLFDRMFPDNTPLPDKLFKIWANQ